MVNSVGFMISEDLASGPGTRLNHSRAFVLQSFIKVKKERHRHQKGDGECPLTSVSNGVIYLLISYYNESKECLEVVKILLDPLS